ncbi:MAG: type VI secretion system tip protein TssI/VgrG [Polyangiaceae bacterium]
METSTLHIFLTAGPLSSADVVSFRVEQRLGVPHETEVLVRSMEVFEPDDLLGAPARLAFGRDAPDHAVDGFVAAVALVASSEDDLPRGHAYRLRIASHLAILEHEVDCRIFQDKDVREIVSTVLAELGTPADRQSWSLAGKYPKREVCVQYRESARAFVSRLLEEEGIFFSSESGERGETLVFEDDSTVARPIEGEAKLRYRPETGLRSPEEAVHSIRERFRTASGKVVLRDYDFKKPELDLTVSKAADIDTDLEIYDHPGLYVDPKEGERLAEVRLQALQAERRTVELESGCPRLVPGRRFELTEAPDDLDGEYVITGAVHAFAEGVYTAMVEAVPRSVRYRAPQVTPRPVIRGPQTAEVVAPKGSKPEEIHTDEHGRCKVRFHWDRYAAPDDTASCWMRVAQPQTGGSMILPRVGWEVLVDFAEGNPDRPTIAGRVYNGRHMPPYALPEGKSRTTLQTASSPGGGGRNEIRIEDKAGSEEVMVQSQKNTTLATGNNKTKSTAVHETKNVGVDAELTVGANQAVKVTNGYLSGVAGSQTLSVSGNRTVEVNAVIGLSSGGASGTTVGGNQMEMDGNPIKALLALAVKAAKEAVEKEVERVMEALDKAVSDKVEQVMGPIEDLQNQAAAVGSAMQAVSNGDLSGAADALNGAGMLPSADDLGGSMLGGDAAGRGGDDGGGTATKGGAEPGGTATNKKKGGSADAAPAGGEVGTDPGAGGAGGGGGAGGADDSGGFAAKKKAGGSGPSAGGDAGGGDGGGGVAKKNKPGTGGGGEVSAMDSVLGGGSVTSALGIDDFIGGALNTGADKLGEILGLDADGGGGSSEANKGGPDGGVGGNSGGDSATGPGHNVLVCGATHAETVGSLKATVAAAGIHTIVNGARTQKVGAAHVELCGGTRAESNMSCKTEKAVGLVVVCGAPEAESVGGARSTMVGGAIVDKVGDACVVQAGGRALLAGAFHKIDASGAIVLKCGGSEVVIDGAGVTIKSTLITITAPTVSLTQAVSEA